MGAQNSKKVGEANSVEKKQCEKHNQHKLQMIEYFIQITEGKTINPVVKSFLTGFFLNKSLDCAKIHNIPLHLVNGLSDIIRSMVDPQIQNPENQSHKYKLIFDLNYNDMLDLFVVKEHINPADYPELCPKAFHISKDYKEPYILNQFLGFFQINECVALELKRVHAEDYSQLVQKLQDASKCFPMMKYEEESTVDMHRTSMTVCISKAIDKTPRLSEVVCNVIADAKAEYTKS